MCVSPINKYLLEAFPTHATSHYKLQLEQDVNLSALTIEEVVVNIQ